jgi:hypothetical protein
MNENTKKLKDIGLSARVHFPAAPDLNGMYSVL